MFCLFLLCVLSFILNIHHLYAIQINSLTVPIAVQNDSNVPVVLECNYTLRPGETGLVVKWILEGKGCVFLWQPPGPPIAFPPLKGRINMTFRATDHPLTKHRAIMIVNPITDLEGEWKCFVSTKDDEDSETKKMIVFVPEQKLTMSLGHPANAEVNFTCSVFGVYPEPKISLFKNNDYNFDTRARELLEVVEWTTSKHHSGRYDMSTVATSLVANLTPGDIVDCELKIPGTGYVKKKSLVYYPPYYTRSGSSILSMLHIILVVAVWIILFI